MPDSRAPPSQGIASNASVNKQKLAGSTDSVQPTAKLRWRDARRINTRVCAQVVKVGRMRIVMLTLLAMVAFASNSLLCRLALRQTAIDAASFTFIRLLSGAIALWLSGNTRKTARSNVGSWTSGLALFAYAAAFSFAYISLCAGTGALLLFRMVQATMIFWGLRKGERLSARQWFGLAIALCGL